MSPHKPELHCNLSRNINLVMQALNKYCILIYFRKQKNPTEVIVIYFDDGISDDDYDSVSDMTTTINAWLTTYFGDTIYSPADFVSPHSFISFLIFFYRPRTIVSGLQLMPLLLVERHYCSLLTTTPLATFIFTRISEVSSFEIFANV